MPNKNSPLRDWLTSRKLSFWGSLSFPLALTILNISQIIYAQHTFPELVTLLDILATILLVQGLLLILRSFYPPRIPRHTYSLDRTGDHPTPPITPSKNKSA